MYHETKRNETKPFPWALSQSEKQVPTWGFTFSLLIWYITAITAKPQIPLRVYMSDAQLG